MPRRPPSAAQLRSQMRAEIRKAEREVERKMKSAVRSAEREAAAEMRRSERRVTRALQSEVDRANRNLQNEADRAANRQQRQLSRGSSAAPVRYTPGERSYLAEVHDAVVADAASRQREHDAFLCHAWADRKGAAAEFHAALRAENVDVWFSEEELVLGASLPRQLDRGIARSRIGLVLVTPALLAALRAGGFAEQELGALLSTGRVVPVCHEASYDDLSSESPLLASRAGLSTEVGGFREVAAKIADSLLDDIEPR
jgi:hypothetical protein